MRASKGAHSGPVQLDEWHAALARAPGSVEAMRVWLVHASGVARNGSDSLKGTALMPNGSWHARVVRGAATAMSLTFATQAEAQAVRDAACTILGDRWVSGSWVARPAGRAMHSCHMLAALSSLVVSSARLNTWQLLHAVNDRMGVCFMASFGITAGLTSLASSTTMECWQQMWRSIGCAFTPTSNTTVTSHRCGTPPTASCTRAPAPRQVCLGLLCLYELQHVLCPCCKPFKSVLLPDGCPK